MMIAPKKSELIDIADLDCIYLSYQEPQKENIWIQVSNLIPWAKRVDGIQGFDAAHKAAASQSETERFILIDGDTVPYQHFFSQQLAIPEYLKKHVFRWKSVNYINGLMYGNGGISCWTREFALNMQTHELSTRLGQNIEFCHEPHYTSMHNVYGVTYPNGNEISAFRAGFREGVKMCLLNGQRPNMINFEEIAHSKNLDKLKIWHNIGSDVPHGKMAQFGARLGTYMTVLEPDWDYTEIKSYDAIDKFYEEYHISRYDEIGELLENRLGLPIFNYTAEQSKFFKHYYKQTYFPGEIMDTEIDVINKLEGQI